MTDFLIDLNIEIFLSFELRDNITMQYNSFIF